MKRLRLSKSALCAWTLISCVACSSDPKKTLESGDYPFITKGLVDTNCSLSSACLTEMGRDAPSMMACEDALLAQFNKLPQSEAGFLHAVNHCGTLPGCAYAACALSDVNGQAPPSFGEDPVQVANITFGCQQKAQCVLDMKGKIADVNLWVANCVGALQGAMYTWSTQYRNDYLDNVGMCGNLTSCALLGCYKY